MAKYVESDITLDFSGIDHFRFETCQGHRNLAHIKEIDFAWWDQGREALFLMELKRISAKRLGSGRSRNLLDNLWKKSIDTLYMISSVWHQTEGSQELAECFPQNAVQPCPIYIFHLVYCDASAEPLLLPFNERLRQMINSYTQLMDVHTFTVISYRQAKKLFPEIVL